MFLLTWFAEAANVRISAFPVGVSIVGGALRKIEGRSEIEAPRQVQEMFIDLPRAAGLAGLLIGAAFLVLMSNRLTTFARRYLSSMDATKRLLSFIFRRQVAKHAQQTGRVVSKRGDLLALGLARLRSLAPGLKAIGLSATVADPDALRGWLVGQPPHFGQRRLLPGRPQTGGRGRGAERLGRIDSSRPPIVLDGLLVFAALGIPPAAVDPGHRIVTG